MSISQDYLRQKLLRRSGEESLRDIAISFHTKTNKSITHGDIYRILHGEFPIGFQKREALGLPPICPYCKRKILGRKKTRDLFSMSDKTILEILENRYEML